MIEAGQNLKLIGRAGVGVDNIDCRAATSAGIIVIKYVSVYIMNELNGKFILFLFN